MDLTNSSFVEAIHRLVLTLYENNNNTPACLNSAGFLFWKRYEAGYRSIDLERAILHLEKSVRLTPDSHPTQPIRLGDLAVALWARFRDKGQMADVDAACSCYERSLLRFGDIEVQRAIEAMSEDAVLLKASYLSKLGLARQMRFDFLGELSDLQQALAAHREAVELTPDDQPIKPGCLTNLAFTFRKRFNRFGELSDLEKAIAALRKAVNLTPDDDPSKNMILSGLGRALDQRFSHLEDLPDLEEAISAKRKALELTPDGHPYKATHLGNLGGALETRFQRSQDLSDLEDALSMMRKAVDLTPDDFPGKARDLSSLGRVLKTRFNHFGELPDLEEAIAVQRHALDLTPNDHSDRSHLLSDLGIGLQARYYRIKEPSDLEEAISATRSAVNLTPDGHPAKVSYLSTLATTVETRFDIFGDVSDRKEAVHAASSAAESLVGPPHSKMVAAYQWCRLSEMMKDRPNTLRAYGCGVSLIPRVAWMGLAVEGRHWLLERIGAFVRSAAAVAIRYGENDMALEWLEQGRSVVWGQTLHLRSPLDLLQARDPARAARLAAISCALEGNSNQGELTAEACRDQLRTLSVEWDQLVAEIREMEGLEDFLGPEKLAQLRLAASICPIVVLNTHSDGCDALILRAEADGVMHIPLTLTFKRAQALLQDLTTVKARHSRGRSTDILDRGFKFVRSESYGPKKLMVSMLAELWSGVVKPVLEALQFSLPENGDDDLPRICWCPTGPLAFLPIHAAGLYDTDERGGRIFDFVVSSYTPTVSALLREPASVPSRPKVLAVAQAQQGNKRFSALPNTSKEIQLLRQRATADLVDLVVAQDQAGTVQYVLEAIKSCNWVHLACHGTQDLDDPTKSAFILADGNLELTEIIKHPLPHAEFAFLSACETASGDEKLAEEAVHLAAGMMVAGYRSVIATMWPIQDKDGPLVADAVYAEMLKGGKADVSRAAHALHKAVHKLRLSGAPFWAWVPFIHMGV